MTDSDELLVLVDQLDELLAEGVDDTDDALELCTVAGLTERLGASPEDLADAVAWREEAGDDVISDLFAEVSVSKVLDALEDAAERPGTEDEIEEAFGDFDDLVAACAWGGNLEFVRPTTSKVAALVRLIPDVFSFMAEDGRTMSRLPAVAGDLALYDYWLAIADSGTAG